MNGGGPAGQMVLHNQHSKDTVAEMTPSLVAGSLGL